MKTEVKARNLTNFFWLLPLFGLVLIIVHYLISNFVTLEDSQQFIYPAVIVFWYYALRTFRLAVPKTLFVLALLLWAALLLRVEFMKKIGYFEGRVVIGRFSDDREGYLARKLYKTLQRIARTYHLPGPALLPISRNFSPSKEGTSIEKTFGTKHSPAMVIFGDRGFYDLILPWVPHEHLLSCENKPKVCLKDFPPNTQFLPLPESSDLFLAVPSYPLLLKINREPKFVIEHYIEWLSAYFSPLINVKHPSRLDVLYEATLIKGLPIHGNERLFSKLLISYEQIAEWKRNKSTFYLLDAKKRLNSLRLATRNSKDFELRGIILNLLSLTDILLIQTKEDSISVRKGLEGILRSKKVSLPQKRIASHNLAMLYFSEIEL